MVLWLQMVLSILIGACLGGLFFGGLWWTVRKVRDGDASYWFFGISFLLRSAVAIVGFYLLLRFGPLQLMAGLLAFLVVRIFLTHWLGPKPSIEIGGVMQSDDQS